MTTVMEFLDIQSIVTLQGCNKRAYESLVPRFKRAWPKSKLVQSTLDEWYLDAPVEKKVVPKRQRLTMLGLNNSGTTTILYKLKLGEVVNPTPTIGFNVEEIVYKSKEYVIWDVGGTDKIRFLWHHYITADTDALIFVVDSSDRARFDIAKEELDTILAITEPGLPLLVFANKMDLPNAAGANEVAQALNLHALRVRPWYI